MNGRPETLGVVLAGGLARRMGGDKGLRRVGGHTLLERVIARLAPQCDGLILSANGDPARFAFLGLPVVADTVPGFAGPLAGLLAALDWAAANRPHAAWVASAPCDSPFLPGDLVARLHAARLAAGASAARALSGGRLHPVVGLWPAVLREDLRRALVEEGIRSVDRFAARHGAVHAVWPAEPFDPFFNANTPDDLEAAEAIARRHPDA